MSGMPVALPALSLQLSAAFMLSRNNAVVPTSAIELVHAVVTAFCASSAVSLESAAFTTTWRQASPPFALRYFAHACTASTEPWNKPGRNGDPVSAATVTVIVFGVMPTSLAVRLTSHEFDVVGVATVLSVPPPTSLPPPQPAATTTATTSRRPNERERGIGPHIPVSGGARTLLSPKRPRGASIPARRSGPGHMAPLVRLRSGRPARGLALGVGLLVLAAGCSSSDQATSSSPSTRRP